MPTQKKDLKQLQSFLKQHENNAVIHSSLDNLIGRIYDFSILQIFSNQPKKLENASAKSKSEINAQTTDDQRIIERDTLTDEFHLRAAAILKKANPSKDEINKLNDEIQLAKADLLLENHKNTDSYYPLTRLHKSIAEVENFVNGIKNERDKAEKEIVPLQEMSDSQKALITDMYPKFTEACQSLMFMLLSEKPPLKKNMHDDISLLIDCNFVANKLLAITTQPIDERNLLDPNKELDEAITSFQALEQRIKIHTKRCAPPLQKLWGGVLATLGGILVGIGALIAAGLLPIALVVSAAAGAAGAGDASGNVLAGALSPGIAFIVVGAAIVQLALDLIKPPHLKQLHKIRNQTQSLFTQTAKTMTESKDNSSIISRPPTKKST